MRLKPTSWSFFAAAFLLATTTYGEPMTLKTLAMETPAEQLFPDTLRAESRTLSTGVVARVAAGTQVVQAPNTKLLLGTGKDTTPTYVFRLSSGRIDISIPDSVLGKIAVLVIGPTGVSGVVKGGHAVAQVMDGTVNFTAKTHEMLVGKGSRWRTLTPGFTRVVDMRAGGSKDAKHVGAPKLRLHSTLAMTQPGAGFIAKAKFAPVANAARYELTLLKQHDAKLEVVSQTTTTSTEAELKGQGPGQYAVMARALSAQGVAGEASAPQALRVMGFELPKGAELVDDGVLLRPRVRLPLVAAEGLKMTYGRADYFVDAPKTIGLGRDAATTVRFQDPSSKGEVTLRLAPYVTKAEVRIGPRSARWPEDKISVKVKLHDGNGRALPPGEKLKTRVSVNSRPVEVSWHRKNNELTGFVARPKGVQGPWVVRVEVDNELGELIGRDFLEVATSAPDSGERGRQGVARR